MNSYLINTFRGGISDENDKGIKGAFRYGYALDIHKRQDSLTCKQALKTGTATLASLPKFFVKGIDGSTYCFCDGGQVYSRNVAGAYTLLYTDTNGEIKGAEAWGDGTNDYLFWATATSLARKLLPGDDQWGDVSQNWKTNLDNVDWHTMKAVAGSLYIANGQYLAQVGYDMSYTNNAFDLIPGNYLKCLDESESLVIMGSYRSDELQMGYLWAWAIDALSWQQKKPIPAEGINAMLEAELRMMQCGQEGGLYTCDFVNMIPLCKIPGEDSYCNPGGADIWDGMAHFGMYAGDYPGIWSYGRKVRNRSMVLNYAYRLVSEITGSTISEIGAVKNIGGTLLASWKAIDGSTTTFGVDENDTANKATAVYEGLEFSNNQPNTKKTFHICKLIMTALPTGCSVGAKYKADKGSWTECIVAGTTSTTFSTANATEAVFNLNDVKAKVLEIGLTLTPSSNDTPEILAVDCEMWPAGDKY